MKKVLILFAHPRYEKSRINKALLEGLHGQDGITLHYLYEQNPDFNVDTACEQELLLASDRASSHKQNDHAWDTTGSVTAAEESGLHPATGERLELLRQEVSRQKENGQPLPMGIQSIKNSLK